MPKRGQKPGIMQGKEDKRLRLSMAASLYSKAFIVCGLYMPVVACRWREMSRNGAICAVVDTLGAWERSVD